MGGWGGINSAPTNQIYEGNKFQNVEVLPLHIEKAFDHLYTSYLKHKQESKQVKNTPAGCCLLDLGHILPNQQPHNYLRLHSDLYFNHKTSRAICICLLLSLILNFWILSWHLQGQWVCSHLLNGKEFKEVLLAREDTANEFFYKTWSAVLKHFPPIT